MQFYNEVLGESYDDNNKPMELEDILNACSKVRGMVPDPYRFKAKATEEHFAGLDWATQTDPRRANKKTNSYTILTIGRYNYIKHRMEVVYVKRYFDHTDNKFNDPDWVVADIVELMERFNVITLGCDWGGGHKENQRIKEALQRDYEPGRVIEFMHTTQTSFAVYDDINDLVKLSRSLAITDFIDHLKGIGLGAPFFEFPVFEGQTSEYSDDLLSVYKFNDRHGKVLYDHTSPDDWMHSLIYLLMVFKNDRGTLEYAA